MKTKLKMIYWEGEKFWVGKLVEHPEIMTQGETFEELKENLKDLHKELTSGVIPCVRKVAELELA